MDKTIISERFNNFAQHECHGSSPLYEHLSLHVSTDKDLLEICAAARAGQPVPNLFFGAVHYLLQTGINHPLKDYYPSINKNYKPTSESFPIFKDFCIQYHKEIINLLHRKLVQTNEVRRSAYLYPSFCYLYEKVKKPLAIIEIGSSSGLTLLWDQYSYSYGNNVLYGKKNSPVHITSKINGNGTPILFKDSPPVSYRIGVDLKVNDLSKKDDFLWLHALIWPEHHERRMLFEKATQFFKKLPARLVEGDGITLLPEIIKEISEEYMICIYHTHVANQIPIDLKYQLLNTIEQISQKRDIAHLYNNMWDALLHLDYYIAGKECKEIIGETDGHGRWFNWDIISDDSIM